MATAERINELRMATRKLELATERLRELIREAAEDGASLREIAAAVNRSPETVRTIIRGST